MNTIKLKQLVFDNQVTINFKSGVNYIHGLNSSGKTTIFNLIQYLLGLKRDFGFFVSFIKNNEASMNVEIDGTDFEFVRSLDSRELKIISNGQVRLFDLNSTSYSSYIFNLLEPKFDFELEENVILPLLRASFLSNSNIERVTPLYPRKEINYLKLGINTIYPRKIKNYLRDLKQDISQREKAYEQIEAYKNDIEFLFRREIQYDEAKVKDITNSTLLKYQHKLIEVINVYEKSKAFLNDLNLRNEGRLLETFQQLDNSFKNDLKRVKIEEPISLLEALNNQEVGYSYTKKSLVALILELTIQKHSDVTNGISLLLNDSALSYLDNSTQLNLRDLVKQINKTNEIQYIEFVTDLQGIDKNDVVYELGKGSRYA